MDLMYAKTVLYAYAHLDALAEQIDELVEKKALSSATDFSPALSQCEKIIGLTRQKTCVLALKLCARTALDKFTQKELDCFDYKYFRTRKKEEYAGFDPASRKYFRLQIKLALKFADRLEKAGYSDDRFKTECLSMSFFREMLARVKERENFNHKNKPQKEKAKIKALKEKIAQHARTAVKPSENAVIMQGTGKTRREKIA
ncbi:MAG: hypothetical protein IJU83_02790 [Clostridia bacterium]|nr:hypothetical protein [Clostridia bacterium]